MSLTSPAWVPAVDIVNSAGASPIVLLCPHASNHIPAEYERLGLATSELQRHIAWDIGAENVTRRLAQLLDATAFLGTYSRLLIDLNRPLHSDSSIVARSEATDIPGNLSLSDEERARRAALIFTPHHAAIAAHVAQRVSAKRPTAIVAIHSFTPVFHGSSRPWHAGVLFVGSAGFAHATMDRLRAHDATLNVGANVPYTVTRDDDHGILIYGDDLGHPAIEIEIRQDLLANEQGQEDWANRLAETLVPAFTLG